MTVDRHSAFEHCKYGTGAQPGAYREMENGTEYSMKIKDGWVSVTFYPANYCTNRNAKKIENVPIENCPIDGWRTYWTNEC